ncbi:50S ribosomal protein L15 [Candidatus Woesearchaeota archaeon]|nr:MAG: 50S ribosomal protein L15 [Candidatus Woesearchaeota archaeon]
MVVNKRKKLTRYRGSTTHGGGSMKKRRGAGHRGGRGMAGGGKRADQKKPSILKQYGSSYFGKHGFKNKTTKRIKALSLSKLNSLVEKNISPKNGVYVVNLKDLGYDKVLGSGTINKKLKLTTDYASSKAVSKIESLGGTVEVLNSSEEEWEDVEEEKRED